MQIIQIIILRFFFIILEQDSLLATKVSFDTEQEIKTAYREEWYGLPHPSKTCFNIIVPAFFCLIHLLSVSTNFLRQLKENTNKCLIRMSPIPPSYLCY